MNVLIACEKSGVIREAFRKRGHNAWSCDLQPPDDGSFYHFQCDVRKLLSHGWDLLIAHPECTYLCNSGVQWLTRTPKNPSPDTLYLDDRRKAMYEACDFFASLYFAPIGRKCIENSQMHIYAADYLQSRWKIPAHTQSIQPYQFGHDTSKKTCLWLQNLYPLQIPSESLWFPPRLVTLPSGKIAKRWSNQSDKDGADTKSPGKNRSALRARSFEGIAQAMSEQWG